MKYFYNWFLVAGLITTFGIIISSCNHKEIILLKGSLDQALQTAQKNNKYLIVVASAENCKSCDIFLEQLMINEDIKRQLSDNAIFLKCDLNTVGNEYLFQATYNIGSPTTYIFSSKGTLLNLLMGNQSPLMLVKIFEEIEDNKIEYLDQQNRLLLSGVEQVEFYNQMLNAWRVVRLNSNNPNQIHNAIKQVKLSIEKKEFIYNNYLAAKLHQKLGDTLLAEQYAKAMLSFNKSFDLFLYQNLRQEMKFLAVNDYDISKEAVAVFDKTHFDFNIAKVKSRPKATFIIKNNGGTPLIINNVLGNCDCMNLEWTKDEIPIGKTGKVIITYHADQLGSFSKVIFVSTNAKNAQTQLTISGLVE